VLIKQPDIISRKEFRSALEKEGIETRPLFGSIPTQQPAFDFLKKEYEGKLPAADMVGKNAFYVGCHQYLDRKDLDKVKDAFISVIEGKIGKL
jgi:CDP-4-dehydro-6-deoxyglucose reductase, E1